MEDFEVNKVKEDWGQIFDFVQEDDNVFLKKEKNREKEEDKNSSLYTFTDGFDGLNCRLQKRLEIVDTEGDLSIVSSQDGTKLIGKVNSFMWNLWRHKNQGSDDVEQIVVASKISTTSSKPALKCIVNFMYTGDLMTDNVATLLEVAENRDNRNLLISQQAQQLIFSSFDLKVIKKVWEHPQRQESLANEMLILYSIAFILNSPEEVFNCENGVWSAPIELLQRLHPSGINSSLEELKSVEKRQWNQNTRTGENGLCYIDMDHIKLSEFLFKWAAEQLKTDNNTQPDGDGVCYFDLEEKLGKLTDMLESKAFDITKKTGTVNPPPHMAAMGAYYYSVLVLNKSLDDFEKQNTIVYPFALVSLPKKSCFKRSLSGAMNTRTKKKLKAGNASIASHQLAICENAFESTQVHPINRLLEEERKMRALTDIKFHVEQETKVVSTSSFLLSLWSSKFAAMFRGKRFNQLSFSFGKLEQDELSLFLESFYTGKLAADADIHQFMRLATILRIPAFIRLGMEKLQKVPLTPSNCFLRYMAETINGDAANASGLLVYLHEHFKDVLLNGMVDVLGDRISIIELAQINRSDEIEFELIKKVLSWCLLHCKTKPLAIELMKTSFHPVLNFVKLDENKLAAVTEAGLIKVKAAISYATERGKYLEQKQQK